MKGLWIDGAHFVFDRWEWLYIQADLGLYFDIDLYTPIGLYGFSYNSKKWHESAYRLSGTNNSKRIQFVFRKPIQTF